MPWESADAMTIRNQPTPGIVQAGIPVKHPSDGLDTKRRKNKKIKKEEEEEK